MTFGSRIWSWFLKLGRSRFLTFLPLFSFLFLSSIYFLTFLRLFDGPGSYPLFFAGLYREDDTAKYAAELLKQKFQFPSYGLSFVLVLFRLREFFRFWFRDGTLFVVFSILLLTALVSDNPDRVVTNLIHLVSGAVAVWLYFSHESRRISPARSAALIVLFSVLFVQIVSFVWFFIHPDSSIDAVLSGRRYGGVANNPNNFGGVCIVSMWAIFTLIYTQKRMQATSLLWLVPISVVAFNAWSTGSATTALDMVFLTILFAIGRLYNQLNRKKKSVLLFTAVTVMFALLFWLVLEQDTSGIAETATESVGKDITFTGRIDLWLVAIDAIIERPILGWSYDNHETIKNSPIYSIPHNHYHNGFLDTLIVGGLVLGFAVLFHYSVFVSRLRSLGAKGYVVYPMLVGFLAVCMANMTEYSMFRNNSIVWMVYFLCFVPVSMIYTDGARPSVSRARIRRKGSRAKGRSRSKRYTW